MIRNKILDDYFNPRAIELAYQRVKCWPDKMVKDQIGIRAFGVELSRNCENLSERIFSGQYKAERGFKFYMPKASKTTRTKSLLFIEDAIVYQAIANKIAEKTYEVLKTNDAFVFGSVLREETKFGINLLQHENPNYFFFQFWKELYQKFKDSVIESVEIDKVKYKFETDITGFFDCIPHYNLLFKLSDSYGIEDDILDLLSDCLNIWSGTKDNITPGVGIPQGTPPSFLLANLLLHDLDALVISKGLSYFRYMDDIKIYAYNESELLEALVSIDKYLKGNGLSLNSKKTSIQKIEDEKVDETVKAFKKLGRVLLSYDDNTGITSIFTEREEDKDYNKNTKDSISLEGARLSEQDGQEEFYNNNNADLLDTEKEIIQFWKSQKDEVEAHLPEYFIEKDSEIQLKDEFDDIDLIIQSAKYSACIRSLRSLNEDPKVDYQLLKYWMYAYRNYFWRANSFGITLSYYNSDSLFKFILDLISSDFLLYEWNRYYAYMTLSFSHRFDDKELRQIIFPLLKK